MGTYMDALICPGGHVDIDSASLGNDIFGCYICRCVVKVTRRVDFPHAEIIELHGEIMPGLNVHSEVFWPSLEEMPPS